MDEQTLTRLQAAIRGQLLRKSLHKVRLAFEEVFSDIEDLEEGEASKRIIWVQPTTGIEYPQFAELSPCPGYESKAEGKCSSHTKTSSQALPTLLPCCLPPTDGSSPRRLSLSPGRSPAVALQGPTQRPTVSTYPSRTTLASVTYTCQQPICSLPDLHANTVAVGTRSIQYATSADLQAANPPLLGLSQSSTDERAGIPSQCEGKHQDTSKPTKSSDLLPTDTITANAVPIPNVGEDDGLSVENSDSSQGNDDVAFTADTDTLATPLADRRCVALSPAPSIPPRDTDSDCSLSTISNLSDLDIDDMVDVHSTDCDVASTSGLATNPSSNATVVSACKTDRQSADCSPVTHPGSFCDSQSPSISCESLPEVPEAFSTPVLPHQHGIVLKTPSNNAADDTWSSASGCFGEQVNQDLWLYPPTGQSREELLKLREDILLETLWIEQAIESRKQYLLLKGQIGSR